MEVAIKWHKIVDDNDNDHGKHIHILICIVHDIVLYTITMSLVQFNLNSQNIHNDTTNDMLYEWVRQFKSWKHNHGS